MKCIGIGVDIENINRLANAVAVSITQPDPETRLHSGAVKASLAALPCALATPTTATGSAPAHLLPPTPAAPRQTSDAHNIATAARARRYPALPPAHPHALKIRPGAPSPALPLPSPCSATRATRPNRPMPAPTLVTEKPVTDLRGVSAPALVNAVVSHSLVSCSGCTV